MTKINGDLIASVSGTSHLGIDGGTNNDSFDFTQLSPFGHIHQLSGIFHDPIFGQSGVLRYSREQEAFQVSVDGGLTFNNVTLNGVTSLGVLGDTNLVGDIDLASPGSGFISIFDSSNASPILFAVDNNGLSGLWRFPTQGFNASVVNEISDFNGTKIQGSIILQGNSGVLIDIVGQTITVGSAYQNGFSTCYVQNFTTASKTWNVDHNLNTENIQIQIWDGAQAPKAVLFPDRILGLNNNSVRVTFNTSQSGQAVVTACPDI